jgi:hypothetical protein
MKKSQNKLTKQKKVVLLTFLNLVLFSWFFVVVISPKVDEYTELSKYKSKYNRLEVPTYQDKKESKND